MDITDRDLIALFFQRFTVLVAHPEPVMQHLIISSKDGQFATIRNVLTPPCAVTEDYIFTNDHRGGSKVERLPCSYRAASTVCDWGKYDNEL